jgi:hypothetical protein
VSNKVDVVRANAAAMTAMIEAQRQEIVRKAAEARTMREAEDRRRHLEEERSRPPPMPMPAMDMMNCCAPPPCPAPACAPSMGGGPPPPPSLSRPMAAPPPPPPAGAGPPAPPAAASSSNAAPEPVAAPDESKVPSNAANGGDEDECEDVVDYTKIPAALDAKFEALDEDSALRPTIIKPAKVWSKRSQASLLSKPVASTLNVDAQRVEKNRAFDLLDALSRSGALPIDAAELHVVIASTHCFDKTLINTVIQDNVNPIEKVERSTLIVATTIHERPAIDLIRPEHVERVQQSSPMLF